MNSLTNLQQKYLVSRLIRIDSKRFFRITDLSLNNKTTNNYSLLQSITLFVVHIFWKRFLSAFDEFIYDHFIRLLIDKRIMIIRLLLQYVFTFSKNIFQKSSIFDQLFKHFRADKFNFLNSSCNEKLSWFQSLLLTSINKKSWSGAWKIFISFRPWKCSRFSCFSSTNVR